MKTLIKIIGALLFTVCVIAFCWAVCEAVATAVVWILGCM